MTAFKTLADLPLSGKRVLLRLDLNVPMQDGQVSDASRIERAAPTVLRLLEGGAAVIILSHFGRPKGRDAKQSLRPLVAPLSAALGGRPVAFAEDCVGPAAEGAAATLKPGQVLLLENLRFHAGEENNDLAFAQGLAKLGDLYVNDAFSVSHRAHASVEALARLLPNAAGLLMQEELTALTRALEKPERPVAAIVGGAKVSTKLELLGNLVSKVQLLIIGGGMANTFLHARGHDIGASLCEKDLAATAQAVERKAQAAGCEILLPLDGKVAATFAAQAPYELLPVSQAVPAGQMILDVGPATVAAIEEKLAHCKTLVWNGPLGAFELPPFDQGTCAVARAVARLTQAGRLLSVAGGGDTVAALAAAGVEAQLSYISAAGGAFLEWLEGKTLPGVAALQS